MRKLWYRFKIWLGLCEKICECGHPLREHTSKFTSLVCFHGEGTREGICNCMGFVWASGDEESDPASKKFIDWA